MPIRKNKISYTIDLKERLKNVRPSKRKKAAKAYGEALKKGIERLTQKQNSPVSGRRRFKPLSKEYKKFKLKQGAGRKANLRLEKKMLNSIKIEAKKVSTTLKITERIEKKKAFNHNTGDTLPRRQFLPDDDQKFKRQVISSANKVLKKFEDPEMARERRRTLRQMREDGEI